MRKCSVISQAGLQVSEFAILSKLGLLGAEATGVVGRRYHLVQLVDLPLKFVCHASRGEPTAFDDSLPPHRGCGLIPRFPERVGAVDWRVGRQVENHVHQRPAFSLAGRQFGYSDVLELGHVLLLKDISRRRPWRPSSQIPEIPARPASCRGRPRVPAWVIRPSPSLPGVGHGRRSIVHCSLRPTRSRDHGHSTGRPPRHCWHEPTGNQIWLSNIAQ